MDRHTKLLTKINSRFTIFLLLIMAVFGVTIYAIFSHILKEETDEKLQVKMDQIERLVKEGKDLPNLYPGIVVQETTEPLHHQFSDTCLTNLAEPEPELFRQLDSILEIHDKRYRITVRESILESEDLLESIAVAGAGVIILLAASLFVINYLTARSVWKPFYQNLKRLENFSVQDLKALTFSPTAISEFESYNQAVSDLTVRVISDYQSLKQFSEDVSHELQTPLSIIRVKLESLVNTNTLNDRQMELVQSVFSSVERLSRLHKSLVLLIKVENRQFTDAQQVDLQEMIRRKIEVFQELIMMKNLRVNMRLDEPFFIKMSPYLADILIVNLLSNAIHHNHSEGIIEIEIKDQAVRFYNSGNQTVTSPELLFRRFHKSDPASKSFGLGLAIVKKICDTHGLRIAYEFSNSMHCFVLKMGL
jgi:signal transduction histidine kinase